MNRTLRTTLKSTVGLLAVASGAYAGYAGVTWLRYGQPDRPQLPTMLTRCSIASCRRMTWLNAITSTSQRRPT